MINTIKSPIKQIKYSKQRELIYNIIKNLDNHPTAEYIYFEVKKEIENISLATVYRNLNLLSQVGMIKKITLPDVGDRFDKTISNHYHMYCSKCKGLYDVNISFLNDINQKTSHATGHHISFHDIKFEGICNNCLNKIN